MAENSEISWTTHTANLWWGCAKVHAGCDHCYAETLSHRWGHEVWGPKMPRRAIKAVWKDLARFQREAAKAGRIDRVFVGSMMDIFEKPFPLIDAAGNSLPEMTGHLRERFFTEVVPNSPNLFFLLLTKRPGNILKYIPEEWQTTPPANVMYGYSVVDKPSTAGIEDLLAVPGRHFLSMEPLLEGLSINYWLQTSKIDWVIVGGESGHHARTMHPEWARAIRDECAAAGTLFHFKQWGEKKAGNLLDGQTHLAVPSLTTQTVAQPA